MRIFTLILCAFALIATGLPLIDSALWWIRIFDFPRLQIAILTLISIILTYFFIKFKWKYKLPLMLLMVIALVYQLQFVVVYTPLYQTQAKKSSKKAGDNSFTLLVSNVRMDNEEKERFCNLVINVNPDVLLITEPDHVWETAIKKLDKSFKYAIKQPLSNTYGMILLSKLELDSSQINYLVKKDIPSIFTKIKLPSGKNIDFYGIHPEPPTPGTDTYERDTELLIVGNKIKKSKNPTVVAGDLNDVGWSQTSKLFRKYSLLVDPREGRGFYSTYSVKVPLMRYPLDHIFYSKEFGLTAIKKFDDIGSDHYPILIGLNYEPDGNNTEGLEKTNGAEEKEVKEKIAEGKNK